MKKRTDRCEDFSWSYSESLKTPYSTEHPKNADL